MNISQKLQVLRGCGNGFGWTVTVLIIAVLSGCYYKHYIPETILAVGAAAAIGFGLCFQIALQWEKAVVFRFGRFIGLRGPGPFFIIPFVDSVKTFIDQRLRVSDIMAEETLTSDTVPVNVDAVIYWMVWDPEKAALEVQNFEMAVQLLALTAVRDIVGQHDLSDFVQNREKIAEALKKILDENTNPWGITCQNVGFRHILIPPALSDAMSRQAQAEREAQARIILGTTEVEIAKKFALAAKEYRDNPEALHLRGMNMLYEGLKGKSSTIIVPSSALDTMNLGAIGGMTGLANKMEVGS